MPMKTLATLLLAFCLSFPVYAQAAENAPEDIIGTVLEVEGLATVTAEGQKPQMAAVDMPVHPGDVLATGKSSRLYVMLIDNTELTLSENGQMTVDDYAFNEDDNTDNHAVYSVVKGAFMYVSGLVAKKPVPDVTINIPQGSIGIRGTKFWAGEIEGTYGVLVGEGEVDVTTTGGSTRLKRGQGTNLRDGTPPEPAKAWPQDKIGKVMKTIALQNPQEVGRRIDQTRERHMLLRDRHKAVQEKKREILINEIESRKENGNPVLDMEEVQRLKSGTINIRELKVLEKVDSATLKKSLSMDAQRSRARMQAAAKAGPSATSGPAEAPKPTLTSPLKNTLGTATSAIHANPMQRIQGSPETATETAKPLTDSMTGTVKDTVNEVVKPVTDTATDTVKSVTDTVKDTTRPVTDAVKDTVKDAVKPVGETLKKLPLAPKQ